MPSINMQSINDIDYNKKGILIDNLVYAGENGEFPQTLYTQKSFFQPLSRDQFFIKAFMIENNKPICQGFIYFYIDEDKKTSEYIGTYVNPKYRAHGISSLLTAGWIRLCLDNEITKLITQTPQRKPFLLYVLKTFSFEISDITEYKSSRRVIDICKKEDDNITKYLLFKDSDFRKQFERSTIAAHDNYFILEGLTSDIIRLDSVILSGRYGMTNGELAYQKSIKIINKHG